MLSRTKREYGMAHGHDDPHVKVSRLPALPKPLDPVVAELFENTRQRGGHILNLHKVSGHAPRLTRAKRPCTYALRNDCDCPRIYRELAICRTAINVECDYELHHHHPLALQAGMSEAQFEALRDWRGAPENFDEKSRAVLAFVDEMTLCKGAVTDATFSALAKHFSPQEIVELSYNATSYYASGLFMKALAIEPDEEGKKAAPGKF
jgi:4-carboxymuconolactone decarboxylase